MKTHSTLGPLTTLILSLAFSEEGTASITRPSPAGVAKSFLFACFLTDILSTRARRNARRSNPVSRIGSAPECQTGC